MKDNVRKILILSAVLVVAAFLVTLVMGKTQTVSFLRGEGGNELTVENGTGEVEILSEREVGDRYLVTVRGKKPGKAYLSFGDEDLHSIEAFYVYENMIVTRDNYFGYATGSESIVVAVIIILIYIIYLLIRRYQASEKENIYQYRNIALLGVIIFLVMFAMNNALSLVNYQGLFDTVERVIKSVAMTSIFLLPLSIVTFVLVTISNINLIRREGWTVKNMLGLLLGLLIIGLTLMPEWVYRMLMESQAVDIYNLNSAGPYIYSFLETVVYLTIAYLECILIATIIVAVRAVKKKVRHDKDYMIILGCKIRDDGALYPLIRGRVDRAIEFRNEQLKATGKDLVFVPSGGQGGDEVTSEAEAMKRYLVEQGISEKRILVENRSKNTEENMRFSYQLIKDKKAKIGFATTNYHVLRAGLIATEQGLKLDGVGSKTRSYFWVNAFIREFIGTLFVEKKKHLAVFLMLVLFIALMVTVTYFGNNL